MPYIHAHCNVKLNLEQKELFCKRAGEIISILPGKSEQWLMVEIEDQQTIFYAGSSEPCAIVTVDLYGAGDLHSYEQFTDSLSVLFSGITNIPLNRIYVRYLETQTWGWNGKNF